MNLYSAISPLRAYLHAQSAQKSIGFVPTMGALHEGHLSLIRAAKEKCDSVVCSIFVNPTQFNNATDLQLYPRPIENDIRLLAAAGCDVLFHPSVAEMYGEDFSKDSADDYGHFIEVLEGAERPGHFDGVITIVKRLFEIVEPTQVFFGQKDYQQCLVVNELIRRSFPRIQMNICPIAREAAGLALSSRNVRLNPQEHEAALLLSKALAHIKQNWDQTNWQKGIEAARAMINSNPVLQLSYLLVAHRNTLEELHEFKTNAVALVAANCGATRLIDNMLL